MLNATLEDRQTLYQQKTKELETLLAGELDAESLAKAEVLNAEIEALAKEIGLRRRAAEREQAEARSAGAKFLGWSGEPAGTAVISRSDDVDVIELFGGRIAAKQCAFEETSYKQAFFEYLRKGTALPESYRKDLLEGADPLGGYFVPSMLAPEVLRKDPAPTELAGRVRTVRTTVDHWSAPKVSYTTDDKYSSPVRVTWVDETPSEGAAEATDPTYGLHRIDVRTAILTIDVSRNQLEDAPALFMDQVRRDFNEAATLVIEDMIVNGTGFGQPKGILENPGGTYEPAAILSGVANDIDADSVKGLSWELPAQYRRNGIFVFNSRTGRQIALFKDTANNYLWKRGFVDNGLGSPTPVDTFDGFPVIYSEFMPDVGNNAYPIAFGDFQGYYLVLRVDFSIQVLTEVKASQNIVQLLGRMRFGGDVARPWMIKLLKSGNA